MEFILDSGVSHMLVSDTHGTTHELCWIIILNNLLLFPIAHGRIWPSPVFAS
jgi:hypothetical protein